MLWGEEPHRHIHWFGLTDGLLWIDVGGQTIYEYSDAALNYFGTDIRYNDYQIVRFLEDLSYLKGTPIKIDWEKTLGLYAKMEQELAKLREVQCVKGGNQ